VKSLVVLRHAHTRKGRTPGDTTSHLSAAGVRRARRLGDELPSFDHVAVGDQPRHLETALALGFAVDEQISWPSGYVAGVVAHHEQWSWSQPFVRYAELVRDGSRLATVVETHLGQWRRLLELVPDGGAALIVSSGGSIEPVLVAALPDADHASWGSAFHQLEGARLEWDGDTFSALELLRQETASAGPTVVDMAPADLPGPRTVVREAGHADVEFLRRMLFAAWRWSPERERTGPSFDAWREEAPRDKYIHDFGHRSGDRGVIAEVNGVPAGAAWYRLLTEDERSIGFVAADVPEVTIAVAQSYRRQGVGSLLIEQLLDQALRHGHRALSLHVDTKNLAARGLYHVFGFVDHHHTDAGTVLVKQLRRA
jgi:GNAT superfamily N-acetyltransferase/broad specificity phosphatase PhoE